MGSWMPWGLHLGPVSSLPEPWVVLLVQLTSLHLGFPPLANPVSRCTEFYLTPSCFFGASPPLTRWVDASLAALLATLLRRSSYKFPFTFLSPLHTLCALFPSAGLDSACAWTAVPLCKIPSPKSDRTAHVACSACRNDLEKPLRVILRPPTFIHTDKMQHR